MIAADGNEWDTARNNTSECRWMDAPEKGSAGEDEDKRNSSLRHARTRKTKGNEQIKAACFIR